jgi:hypothetical protein
MSLFDPTLRTARRRSRLALVALALALPLAAGASAGFVAEPPPSPASGYVYYGDAAAGGGWGAKNFDNLSHADVPAYRNDASGEPGEFGIREGDLLRARGLVNVRARPWTVRDQEPPVVGTLRPGERVVVRDIQPVGLTAHFGRMAFWIRYEHPPRSR